MASTLPWAWIVETLADFKPLDSHLLQAFMRAVPDFAVDSCEMARERVSLRILEEILDLIPANPSNTVENGGMPSSSGRDFRIDASERAVDVLFKVTATDLTRGAELKHDLNQFILQKRACLPKHALEQLKELILEGNHPSASSLMERSGLATNLSVGDHNQISRSELDDKGREPLLNNNVSIDDERPPLVKLITQPLDESVVPPEAQLDEAHKTINHHQDLRQSICIDDTHGEHSEQPETSGRSYGGQHIDLNHDLDDEVIAHEKYQFINSQNTASHNSQGGVWTEQNLCIKCDEGGQLLICSGSSCPIAVHESCLGSPANFELTSNFYCPFCSYTRVHAEYRKVKQKFAIARKTLSSFMGRDLEHPKQSWKLPAKVCKNSSEATRNSNCLNKFHADQQHGEVVDNHLSKQVSEHLQKEKSFLDWSNNSLNCREPMTSLTCDRYDVPLIQKKKGLDKTVADTQCATAVEHRHQVDATECSNENLPCKEVYTSIIIGRHDVSSINMDRNCVEMVKESQIIRDAENQDQAEPCTVCDDDTFPCNEAETSFVGEIHNVISGKGDNAQMVDNHQSINDTDCDIGNTPCIQAKTSPIAKTRSAVKRKSVEMPQSSHQDYPAFLPSVNVEETDRNQTEDDFSDKTMKHGKEKQHEEDFSNKRSGRPAKRHSNPLIPHARRTKLLWTVEEEEVLKEAVQKFSSPSQGSLPWTRIMEFGSKVFHKTRTPVDLKDKWRNIMIKEGSTARKR